MFGRARRPSGSTDYRERHGYAQLRGGELRRVRACRRQSRPQCAWAVRRTSSPAKSSSVQRARPAGGFEQAVATRSASSLPESLRRAPGRGSSLSAASRLPSAKRRLVRYGRAAHADARGNLLIAGAGIRRKQNLRALELARRLLATAQECRTYLKIPS